MNILVVNNLYPPSYIGGYELGCCEAVEALRNAGHEVIVLTSTYPDGISRVEGHVHRRLTILFGHALVRKVIIKEAINQFVFRQTCLNVRPDVVFFWKLTDLSMVLIPIAHDLGVTTCYYVFDHWIARWKDDRWSQIQHRLMSLDSRLFLKKLWESRVFPPKKLIVENAFFASEYLKKITENVTGPIKNAEVVPWGVDTARFKVSPFRKEWGPNRVLYVGQIVQHKGVHIAIEGFSIACQKVQSDLNLTVVGDLEQSPAYVLELKKLVKKLAIEKNVTFTGKVERNCLPEIYADHDILIFSSLWDEPFGLTPLEAMGSGLVVVGTGTGGSAETLIDEYNALLYQAEKPMSCADKIISLIENVQFFAFIRNNAIGSVIQYYSLSKATKRIEALLLKVVGL